MATDNEHIEVPTGAIDGLNQTFTTSASYVGASLHVFWNGIKQNQGDSQFGWSVTGGTTFQTATAPVVGDSIMCRYIEA